jgi:hypothetical protein
MEILYGLGGMALCLFAVGFMLHGFPKITINKHYYESEKKRKNNQ